MTKQKIKANKVNGSFVYPMSGGLSMVFLDNWTMLFGDASALKQALDARDGGARSLNANTAVTDMITSVDQGTVWSVLDQQGTQTMMKSALGGASDLADYETIKQRLTGSRYTMDFDHGVDFNLNVGTSDNMTAATLSSVMKAGLLYKKMNATPTEKARLTTLPWIPTPTNWWCTSKPTIIASRNCWIRRCLHQWCGNKNLTTKGTKEFSTEIPNLRSVQVRDHYSPLTPFELTTKKEVIKNRDDFQ